VLVGGHLHVGHPGLVFARQQVDVARAPTDGDVTLRGGRARWRDRHEFVREEVLSQEAW
jgi:hypothetical protein